MLPPDRVQAEIQRSADDAAGKPVDLVIDSIQPSRSEVAARVDSFGIDDPEIRALLEQRLRDMHNTRRDTEWLIKGILPARYIDGPDLD